MKTNTPLIELNNEDTGIIQCSINDEDYNPDLQLNEIKIKKLKTKLIIISLILLIIIIISIIIIIIINKKSKNNRIPVIFDVDEGGDDMISYIIANNSKIYNILGITTISPTHNVENVTNIWLRFLKYMNFDNKVYKGEDQPLNRITEKSEFFHDYQLEFPLTDKIEEKINAVDFMVDTIKNYKQKITLFLLAPLTNFAKAFQKDKTIIKNIKEIIIMGGTKSEGNILYNKKAEYNIYMDADAANIVFNCGIKIKVMGIDVTHKVEFTDEIYENYLKFNTSSSLLAYSVMKGTFLTWGDNFLHDPITVLYHLNKKIIKLKEYHSYINTTNPDVYGTDYGTIMFIEPNETFKANIEYSEEIDLDLYWKTLNELVQKY